MNKSFDTSQSGHYLPPINRNQSGSIPKTNRSQSNGDMTSVGQLNATPLTRKLIATEQLKNVEEYENMNEKELLREHQNLLKILKKYQQLIDINLTKKQKEREKQMLHKSKVGDKKVSKEQMMNGEVNNNKKIIANYLRQIKDLQSAQNHRKLHQVLDEKAEVNEAINKLKKQIFDIKNKDTEASRKLMTDRGHIEKELNDAEKDLKTELTRNAEYKKKISQLTEQLKKLKDQCGSINIAQLNAQSHQKEYLMALSQKKMQLEQAQRNYSRVQESIQQVMINKTKRNKNLSKDIEGMDKKMTQLNNRIQAYKEKVTRYQKVIQKK